MVSAERPRGEQICSFSGDFRSKTLCFHHFDLSAPPHLRLLGLLVPRQRSLGSPALLAGGDSGAGGDGLLLTATWCSPFPVAPEASDASCLWDSSPSMIGLWSPTPNFSSSVQNDCSSMERVAFAWCFRLDTIWYSLLFLNQHAIVWYGGTHYRLIVEWLRTRLYDLQRVGLLIIPRLFSLIWNVGVSIDPCCDGKASFTSLTFLGGYLTHWFRRKVVSSSGLHCVHVNWSSNPVRTAFGGTLRCVKIVVWGYNDTDFEDLAFWTLHLYSFDKNFPALKLQENFGFYKTFPDLKPQENSSTYCRIFKTTRVVTSYRTLVLFEAYLQDLELGFSNPLMVFEFQHSIQTLFSRLRIHVLLRLSNRLDNDSIVSVFVAFVFVPRESLRGEDCMKEH